MDNANEIFQVKAFLGRTLTMPSSECKGKSKPSGVVSKRSAFLQLDFWPEKTFKRLLYAGYYPAPCIYEAGNDLNAV
jgi:hypothetical protein